MKRLNEREEETVVVGRVMDEDHLQEALAECSKRLVPCFGCGEGSSVTVDTDIYAVEGGVVCQFLMRNEENRSAR